MGWEVRHGGRWYLYRNRRVNGKPVKEYLAAKDRFGFGDLMAHDLDRLLRWQAKLRRLRRAVRADDRARADGLVAAASAANAGLRTVAEGLLYAIGFHRHHRGEWRMKRELKSLKTLIDTLKTRKAGTDPAVVYQPPAADAEAAEVFARARAGDAGAQERVRVLIRDRRWVDWLGDLGRQATAQLIRRAAGGDPVWEAGIAEKANALRAELLGDDPSVLEQLLVRRVVNGWVATHALELTLAVRPPASAGDRAHLDKALTGAQKRFAEAVRELARVRRLQAPRILARLNLTAPRTIIAGRSGGATDGV